VIGLAMAGAFVLCVLWIRAAEVGRGRMATVTTVALLALFVVQAGNSQVWERYFDPAILVAVAWLVAMGIDRTRPHSAGRAAAGALALAAVQAAITAVTVWVPAFR
jgi:heme A synthase